MLVAWGYGGITPENFLTHLQNAVDTSDFWVGIIKAPFMALVIGLIASTEGFMLPARRIARPAGDGLGRQIDLHGHRRGWHLLHLLQLDPVLSMAEIVLPAPLQTETSTPLVIKVRDLSVSFGTRSSSDGLDLDVRKGEVMGFVGGSGMGKSVLTRTILGLTPKQRGLIEVFGADLDTLDLATRKRLERRFGVMFQMGALFSGLTVKQNVQLPLREHLRLTGRLADELAMLKIELVGLEPDAADKYPSELSGGMIKRAALARALALDPELVFLDEPTSGLDPIGAAEFDELIATLQKTLGLTVFMVTHDLDSLYAVCDRVAALADGKVIATGPISTMLASEHPWLRNYFPRQACPAGGRGLTTAGSARRPCRCVENEDSWKRGPITL